MLIGTPSDLADKFEEFLNLLDRLCEWYEDDASMVGIVGEMARDGDCDEAGLAE